MRTGGLQMDLEWKKTGGGIVLEFSRLSLGFRSVVIRIQKAAGETIENDIGHLKTISPWLIRLIYGIRELFPVLEITGDRKDYIRFYRGRDRKGVERIYSVSHGPEDDSGGALVIGKESYEAIVATLDSVSLQ